MIRATFERKLISILLLHVDFRGKLGYSDEMPPRRDVARPFARRTFAKSPAHPAFNAFYGLDSILSSSWHPLRHISTIHKYSTKECISFLNHIWELRGRFVPHQWVVPPPVYVREYFDFPPFMFFCVVDPPTCRAHFKPGSRWMMHVIRFVSQRKESKIPQTKWNKKRN